MYSTVQAGQWAIYTVSPPLPAGITIDRYTGTIFGTPSSPQDAAIHIVTADLGEGVQKKASLSITIGHL